MHGRQRGSQVALDDRELLRIITNTASDAIITIDASSTIVYVNAGVERVFGYQPDQLLGTSLTQLMPEYLRHVHEQAVGRYLDTGKRHIDWTGVELPGVHADGHELELEVSFGESVVNGRHLFTGVMRDVSDRKRAEEERRESEERFRLLVEGVKDYAIFMLDTEGCVSSWNAGAERITGYQAHEIIEHHFSRFYTKEDLEAGKPERELEIAGSQGRYEEEGWRVRKDGTTYLSNVILTALYDDEGALRGYAKVTRDITAPKEAEWERERLAAVLEAERERLQEIFMQAPAFIATLRGPDHRFENANRLYLELSGRRDVVGLTVREVLPEIQGQGYLELLDRVYQSGEPYRGNEVPIELYREGEDAPTNYYLNFVFQPLREADGSVSGIFVHGIDVTEQVLARQEVEEAGRRLSFLVEASATLASTLELKASLGNLSQLVVTYLADWCTICLVEGQGKVRRMGSSHADRDKLHLAYELLQGPPPTAETHPALFSVLDSGEPKIYPRVDEDLLSEITLDREQVEILRPMGMGSVLIVPLIARQQVIGAIFMARSEASEWYGEQDVELAMELARRAAVAVDNARLYQQTQEMNQDLEQRVEERTKELESFSYSVSHDLRAPLRGIDGFSQALLEDYSDRLDDTGKDFLRRVRAGSRRMGDLIDGLLNLSRLSRSEKHWETVDLSEIAGEVIGELGRREPERQVEAEIEPGLVVGGDRRLLTVLLENLLENAWKFTRKRERAVIAVGRTASEGGPAFFVRDNGAGFDMDYGDRLFVAFQRLHRPDDFEGTGIGLATVQRIVERHGGTVWAEGQVDQGATFYFTLGEQESS